MAMKEEIRFRVGDRVRVLGDPGNPYFGRVGQVWKVTLDGWVGVVFPPNDYIERPAEEVKPVRDMYSDRDRFSYKFGKRADVEDIVRRVKVIELDKEEGKAVLKLEPEGLSFVEYFLVIKEKEPELRREGGWYILRQWIEDKEGNLIDWRDFARPGWGATYWLKEGVVKELGLE